MADRPLSARPAAGEELAGGGPAVRDLADLPRILESRRVAGLSLAFTGPTGVVAEAWGLASADGTQLTPSSVLQTGSVSKAVTAYAAHRLAADGRLDLDADVNGILRSVTVAAPMGLHAPELHLTLPGQEPVRLLPVAPHRWRVPGIAGVDVAFNSPDSMRISIYGRHIDAARSD